MKFHSMITTRLPMKKINLSTFLRNCAFKRYAWHSFRFLPATILFIAATLKASQFYDGRPVSIDLTYLLSYDLALIAFEMCVACWIVSNLMLRQTKIFVAVLFGLFAIVSLIKFVIGKQSCGCFGQLEIPPILTCVMDTFLSISSFRSTLSAKPYTDNPRGTCFRAIVLGITAVTMVSFAVWTLNTQSKKIVVLESQKQIISDGSYVLVKPETWISHECPLLDYCDSSAPLKHGRRLVVVYRGDCEACHKTLQTVRQLATARNLKLGVINMDASPKTVFSDEADYSVFLSKRNKWLIDVPCAFELRDGAVVGYVTDIFGTK